MPRHFEIYNEQRKEMRFLKIKLGLKRGCPDCERIIKDNARHCRWCGRTFREDEIKENHKKREALNERLVHNDPELLKHKRDLESYERFQRTGCLVPFAFLFSSVAVMIFLIVICLINFIKQRGL